MSLPAPASRCAWELLSQVRKVPLEGGTPSLEGFGGHGWVLAQESEVWLFPVPVLIERLSGEPIGFSVPQFPCPKSGILASPASQCGREPQTSPIHVKVVCRL